MAIMMTRSCCCEGANLRLGVIVAGILSLIGGVIQLALTIESLVWTRSREWELHNPNATDHFSNTTIKHWTATVKVAYLALTFDLISLIVAALLIYGAIKRIRPLLYTYIVWTIIIILSSFCTLVFFGLDGPRLIVIIYIFHFSLLLGTGIYFILVVFSYAEFLREGGDELQAVTFQGPGKGVEEQSDSKMQYSRFDN